jgi:glycosyltransferase involved in cell wall biosynthesis
LEEGGSDPGSSRRRPRLPDSARTILFFGAIRDNKGLDVLMRAMPRILERVPAAKLVVAGEPVGDYRKYTRLIQELEIEEAVHESLGYVDNAEVADYFHSADIAVLPYREITQSGVLQVAFACETPVVASDLPGFRETIQEGETGLLVPPDDPAALADACSDLLLDPERAVRMGTMARRLSERLYSWDAIARKTMDEVYGSVI